MNKESREQTESGKGTTLEVERGLFGSDVGRLVLGEDAGVLKEDEKQIVSSRASKEDKDGSPATD